MSKVTVCRPNEKKLCRGCGDDKEPGDFYWSENVKRGKRYRVKRALCKQCHNKKVTSDLLKNRPVFVLRVTRHRDRASGLENDLTREFVTEQLTKPCTYCGSTVVIGLDRKNNTLGHTQDNVVPACLRCNFIRRDMPYDAWMEMVAGVRRAANLGLFGDWVGGPHKAHRIS